MNRKLAVVEAGTGSTPMWDKGELTKLPSLGGETGQTLAYAINERNKILGWSERKSSDGHAVLWTLKR